MTPVAREVVICPHKTAQVEPLRAPRGSLPRSGHLGEVRAHGRAAPPRRRGPDASALSKLNRWRLLKLIKIK